jgi:hypothetical protein
LTLPNFIIVGAAKAGTTALYWYLSEHPAVYMSPVKETFYFAYGVDEAGRLLYGDPDVHRFPIKTLPEYEALFAAAGDATAIGEASPIYLECPQAAERIRSLIPGARIIASLRQPVDRAYSDYIMYLRRRGRRLDPAHDLRPDAAWARPDSRWMQVSRYAAQVRRYVDRFPAERIHVAVFDDLKRDAVGMTQSVYRFVGVDPSFRPDVETPHAAGGVPKSRLLERLFSNRALRSALQPLMPRGAANWVRRFRSRTMEKPPALPPDLRRELTEHFRADIAETSALIGRNLDHWL